MAVLAGVWFFKSVFDISLFKLLLSFPMSLESGSFTCFYTFADQKNFSKFCFFIGQKYVKVDNNLSASALLNVIMHNCNVKYMRPFKSYPSTIALLGFFSPLSPEMSFSFLLQ